MLDLTLYLCFNSNAIKILANHEFIYLIDYNKFCISINSNLPSYVRKIKHNNLWKIFDTLSIFLIYTRLAHQVF